MSYDDLADVIKRVDAAERRIKKKLNNKNLTKIYDKRFMEYESIHHKMKPKFFTKIRNLIFNLYFLLSLILEYYQDELYDIYYVWRYKYAIERWIKLAGLDKLPDEKIVRPKPWQNSRDYTWIVKKEEEPTAPNNKWWHFNSKTKPEDLQTGFYHVSHQVHLEDIKKEEEK